MGIINDMLDLSKIEAGKLELNIAEYELASFVSDSVQINMLRIGSKPVEFDLHISEDVPNFLIGDELRLRQILNNILSNAFKYTKAGRVTFFLNTEKNPDAQSGSEHTLVMTVVDTGEGMAPWQVERLFDEYSRFNESANRTTEGTGLGMNITKNLVRLMDGTISVKSKVGVGSIFTVRLPQGCTGATPIGKELSESLRHFRVGSRAQMRHVQITRELMPYGSVLIVDDVETNIFVAKGLLVPYRIKVDEAYSGQAAIKKIKDGNVYDVIFMDHMMPEMDGFEATQLIRGMGYTAPIVALTANAVSGQSEKFLKNGFDDFISKPIDVRYLNIVLNKFVRDKHPEKAKAMLELNKGDTSRIEESKCGINIKIAEVFVRDAEKSYGILNDIIKDGSIAEPQKLRSYITQVHGLRSALANVKNHELATFAGNLEHLANENEFVTIAKKSPAFLAKLRDFVDEIRPKSECGDISGDAELFSKKLQEIREACKDYDEITAESALEELESSLWTAEQKELLSKISHNLLLSNFDEIIEISDEFIALPPQV